jgi:hypothetical protein
VAALEGGVVGRHVRHADGIVQFRAGKRVFRGDPFDDRRKNQGEQTVSMSFGVLVQTAMGRLIENATVSSALASVDSYLDKQKIAAAMADAPPADPR